MTWCPCHGSTDVPCTLRGDPPVVTRQLCACVTVKYVRQRGVVVAKHQYDCELRSLQPDAPARKPVAVAVAQAERRHVCHVPGCQTPVKPEYLMCGRHWAIVPKSLQAGVWKHYRRGQCDDMNPSREWHAAADAAIRAVVAHEKTMPAKRVKGTRRVLPGQLSFGDERE